MSVETMDAAEVPFERTAVRWFREPQLWCLVLLAIAIYVPRLTTLTIRGEESRRAVIAREMLRTGDWVVPRTQGVPRLSRPPLQNWLIAGTALLTGDVDPWAIRLPGVACTVATMMLVYWYARRRLQPTAAFVAAAAYGSMLQVLEQGRTGETEPVFTFMMAAALLLWHGGLASGWQPVVYWSVGAACAGLATLTKGLQGPLYFFASTWAYLILTGQWRWLLSRGHLSGVATFVVVVGAWQAPFTWMLGLEDSWLMYFSNVAHRFSDRRLSTFLTHLLVYPPSVICGCLAPWSLFYLAFTDRDIRRQVGPRRDMLLFLVISVIVCFPSVWLPPEARPRYFMPLFPCLAVLVGISAELLIETANTGALRLWSVFVRGGGVLMGAAAVGLVGWALVGSGIKTPPLGPTIAYGLLALGLGLGMRRVELRPTPWSLTQGAALMAAFLGITFVGPVMTNQQQRSEDVPAAVAAMHQRLPADARLVSFDHLHHLFLHYYAKPVPLLEWPLTRGEVPPGVEFFSVHVAGTEVPELPFPWEEVASLSMDRNRHAVPERRIVVGRILEGDSTHLTSNPVHPAVIAASPTERRPSLQN